MLFMFGVLLKYNSCQGFKIWSSVDYSRSIHMATNSSYIEDDYIESGGCDLVCGVCLGIFAIMTLVYLCLCCEVLRIKMAGDDVSSLREDLLVEHDGDEDMI